MKTDRGTPSPLGCSVSAGQLNFAVYAEEASQLSLCLYAHDGRLLRTLPLVSSGNVWHLAVAKEPGGFLYCYQLEKHAAKSPLWLSDPYAKDLNTLHLWRRTKNTPAPLANTAVAEFDWGNDASPAIPIPEMVIYEAHVKGFTVSFPDLPEKDRGKYGGLANAEVVAYLKNLGVTSVELLPVHAKAEDHFLKNKGLTNYWGYNTLNYFAPESEYAATDAVTEFKAMVKALHHAGIEVILDVVYNHTGEGNQDAPPVSFRGFADKAYYVADDAGNYRDYTHCGNSLRAEHETVRNMILDSLRYWAGEMHVDGFRFDLAPTMFRVGGDVTWDNDLQREIEHDPILKKCKLIVEPWDLGPDGYCRGRFPQPYIEWNDTFRDAARQFWKGERPAQEISALMVHRGRPVVNFITCHDGFTLRDLVSYGNKRNEENGEDNLDGSNHSHSFNCGAEGDTTDENILALRKRMRKNLLATLLFAQDIPMLLAGDEMGNTQRGNNNAYCQDNEISWLSWQDQEEDLTDYVRRCLLYRKKILAATHPHVMPAQNVPGHAFAIRFDAYLLLFNASEENALFPLPDAAFHEILHASHNPRADHFQGVYLLAPQSAALLASGAAPGA